MSQVTVINTRAKFLFNELPVEDRVKINNRLSLIAKEISELRYPLLQSIKSLRGKYHPSNLTGFEGNAKLCMWAKILLLFWGTISGSNEIQRELANACNMSLLQSKFGNQLRSMGFLSESEWRCLLRYASAMYVLHNYVYDVTKKRLQFSDELCSAIDGAVVEGSLTRVQRERRQIILRGITGHAPLSAQVENRGATGEEEGESSDEEDEVEVVGERLGNSALSSSSGTSGESSGRELQAAPIAIAVPVLAGEVLPEDCVMVQAIPVAGMPVADARFAVSGSSSGGVLGKRAREATEWEVGERDFLLLKRLKATHPAIFANAGGSTCSDYLSLRFTDRQALYGISDYDFRILKKIKERNPGKNILPGVEP